MKDLIFRLGMQTMLGLVESEIASEILSESVIKKISLSTNGLTAKKKWKNDYLVIVLGSTGMKTMSFASDIDLIFVVKNSKKYETIQKEFQDILGILKKELAPFTVDCRLRPEGESSQLVWDAEKYSEYLNKRARIWELQSFLKARFVCGNIKLHENLVDSFLNKVFKLTREEILKGITDIRSKSLSSFPAELNLIDLKKNSGGLSDIEYITHYLLLSGKESLQNLIGNSIPAILKNLKGNKKVLIELSDNYIFLKKLEIFNQLAYNSSSSKISGDEKRFEKLANLMSNKNGLVLKSKLNLALKSSRDHFKKFILEEK